MVNSYYNIEELLEIGFLSVGKDVSISRKASIYGACNIRIGNHVRIDDFCILSGNISIGNYVHINPYSGLFAGTAGIVLEDYTNLASRTTIYAISDDYSGETLTSPLIPEQYKKIKRAPVIIGRYSIVGTGCSFLPGVTVGEGCAVGAMSLVNKDLAPWGIYAGVPCRLIKGRSKKMLELIRDEY